MLPLVINNNPSRLVQVTMNGPVGTGGVNARNDVYNEPRNLDQ